jgi:ABC-type transport system involved in multi-copper enzyme maturation permease subunit
MVARGCGAVGVACSSFFFKNYFAIGVSYLATLSVQGAGLLIAHGLSLLGLKVLKLFTPLPPRFQLFFLFFVNFIFCLLMVTLGLMLTVAVLRRPFSPSAPRPRRVPAATPADTWPRRLLRQGLSWLDLFPGWQDRMNPVFVKEFKLGVMDRSLDVNIIIGWLAFALITATSLGYLFPAALGMDHFTELRTMIGSPILIHMTLASLAAPIFVAHSLAKEVEFNNMDLLRTTLLTPGQIVSGKIAFGFALLTPLFLLSLLISSPLALVAFPSLAGIASLFASYLSLALSITLALSLSMLASALTRRVMSATLLSYLLILLVFGGAESAILVLSELKVMVFSEDLLYFWSPLMAFFHNIYEGKGPSLLTFYWLANTALFGLAAAGALAATIWVFERRLRQGG